MGRSVDMSESEFSHPLEVSGTPVSEKRKTALVVDDSKLARYVLKEMLIEQGIKVETAESAEEALGSLSAYKPDVIFMDHMMPGMDGFQAVQAIKNDPKTAKIPILMYTSKDEGVYVNQARALGAVGVLPKKLKPVQLERVLQQLNLIATPKAAEKQEEANHPAEQATQQRIIKDTQHSLEELARSASEDLEKDSMRQLFRQLFVEQRDTIKQDQNELLESMVRQVQPAINNMVSSTKRWQRLGVMLFMILILPVYFLMPNVAQVEDSIEDMKIQHAESMHELESKIANLKSVPVPEVSAQSTTNWEVLQWALNQNNQIAFNKPINSPAMLNQISELFSQLSEGGFNGTIQLQYHEGNFCIKTENGVAKLAVENATLGQCQFTKDVKSDGSIAIQEVRSYVSNLNDEYSGIEVQLEEMGYQYTLLEYPIPSVNITAKEWNRIAAHNNRLQIELISQ